MSRKKHKQTHKNIVPAPVNKNKAAGASANKNDILSPLVNKNEVVPAPASKRDAILWVLLVVGLGYLLVEKFGLHGIGYSFLALIGFGSVIIVHEFGHFITAKMTGMHVEGFSIGFPPVFLGLKRTEQGFRIRLLPFLFKHASNKNCRPEEQDEEKNGKIFYFGKGYKGGETEYCIGLIPFGGYVKILGQEDLGKNKTTDDPRAYCNKSVWRRMAVIAAGVICNFIMAIVISVIAFNIGIKNPAPIAGGIIPNSPAEKAGILPGDEVIEIGGKRNHLDYMDVAMGTVLTGKDKSISVTVRHLDGSEEQFDIVPEKLKGSDGSYKMLGIAQPYDLVIPKMQEKSAALLKKEYDLQRGDRIVSVDGIAVEHCWDYESVVKSSFAPIATLGILRESDGDANEFEIEVSRGMGVYGQTVGVSDLNLYSLAPRLIVSGTIKESGLRAGDVILRAGSVAVPNYAELRNVTKAHKDKPLSMVVLRAGNNGVEEQVAVEVVPTKGEDDEEASIGISLGSDLDHAIVGKVYGQKDVNSLGVPAGATITQVNGVAIASFYDFASAMRDSYGTRTEIGWTQDGDVEYLAVLEAEQWVDFGKVEPSLAFIPYDNLNRLYKAGSVGEAISMGYKRALYYIKNAYLTLGSVFQGQVSAKEFVGPLGIAKISYMMVESVPPINYIFFIGMISAFIGALNIVPVLPFDGGHLLFLAIEKVKGSPVNERIQYSLATVGWVFMMMLFVYVTFNDIIRFYINK